ncbi:DsrE/DsrF/TusD sulfur relay family protein [Coprothermobacter platensis]|uniref:DsrE/DsrF/TusD sulfur relay family protein n=1 Tax=Coprothermobacter platensis TaxID=108819 RepID=UPI000379DD93|nr:DsrE family protein [Coprothermobacter platensis]
MHIVLQVINPPYSYEDMDSAIKIADAALKKGHKVSIFLFADSVLSVNSKVKPIRADRNIPNLLKDLASRGAEVHICGLCFEYRGLDRDAAVEGSQLSGVPEMATLLTTADRYVNFTV